MVSLFQGLNVVDDVVDVVVAKDILVRSHQTLLKRSRYRSIGIFNGLDNEVQFGGNISVVKLSSMQPVAFPDALYGMIITNICVF